MIKEHLCPEGPDYFARITHCRADARLGGYIALCQMDGQQWTFVDVSPEEIRRQIAEKSHRFAYADRFIAAFLAKKAA